MGDYKPEWTDENRSDSFMSIVRKGVESNYETKSIQKIPRFQKRIKKEISIEELINGVLSGDRAILARAITLIESNAEHHFQKSQQMLQQLLPHSGKSIRIGITGVPGAGKSTFIESFGSYLCENGYSVAVLAVDPSSSVSGGSILGDKTRMERLTRQQNAFIRPSPSGGALGGVHRKTRETMHICEAAGFDVILIETVGVGQSETIVRGMVDFFMLLVLTGAGDELQGMKKGIMELADAIVVNKADGANKALADITKMEYNRILHFLQPATKGWKTKAYTCSALNNKGIKELWEMIQSFQQNVNKSGVFEERRRFQMRQWMESMIIDQLKFRFFRDSAIKSILPKIENEVIAGERTVSAAVEYLFQVFQNNEKK